MLKLVIAALVCVLLVVQPTVEGRRRHGYDRHTRTSFLRGSRQLDVQPPVPYDTCCVTRTFNYPYAGHPAVDIGCDGKSVGVVALADGEVVGACDGQDEGQYDWPTTKCGQGGNYVKIKYNINGAPLYVFYYHLAKGSVTAAIGEHKKKGEQVGMSGNTGNSFGIHLDVTAQTVENPNDGYYDPNSVVNFAIVTGLDGWDACYV